MVAALGVLAVPAARAALPWTACSPVGFQCATLGVPLDRSGVTAGTIALAATRSPAATQSPATTAVVALAGGPGQAALPIAAAFEQDLKPLLGHADLLVFDQRGTGRSNPLTCAALSLPSSSLSSAVRRCAGQLGPARAFFTTQQSVEDIEALRVAGGYAKLVLYGVSYGTKVALAYAAAHPAQTQALILDSVVLPEGPAATRASTLNAVPRVIGSELCGGGACASITSDAVGDVRRLAAKLAKHGLSGPVLSGSGRTFTAHLSADGLVSILVSGDLDPTLRAELPGSVRAALAGDVRPILRLSARSSGLENRATNGGFQQAAADSEATFFVTACEESSSQPWTRGAPLDQRQAEAESWLQRAPESAFGIFPRGVALGGLPSLCLGYPVASAAPAAPAALPDVPVLVLDGRDDLRTPLEDATALAGRFPRATLLAVPHTGHSVLGSEPASCASDGVAAFAAGTVPAACGTVANPYGPTPRPPLSLAQVATVKGLSRKLGRTVNAAAATLTDARRQVIGAAIGSGRLPSALGGLRSGSVKVAGLTRLTLRAYEYVPGVRVTGTYAIGGSATLSISGRSAASGTLTFRKNGDVSGRLDGRRISASRSRALRAAVADALPTLAQALAQGRVVAGSR